MNWVYSTSIWLFSNGLAIHLRDVGVAATLRTSCSFSMRFVSFAMIRRPRPAPTLWLFNTLLWTMSMDWFKGKFTGKPHI